MNSNLVFLGTVPFTQVYATFQLSALEYAASILITISLLSLLPYLLLNTILVAFNPQHTLHHLSYGLEGFFSIFLVFQVKKLKKIYCSQIYKIFLLLLLHKSKKFQY